MASERAWLGLALGSEYSVHWVEPEPFERVRITRAYDGLVAHGGVIDGQLAWLTGKTEMVEEVESRADAWHPGHEAFLRGMPA